MGATSANFGACACGSRGDTTETHEMNDPWLSTEGYAWVQSLESDSLHETHTWWCYTHGRSEGECLTNGTQSHGRDEGDRCGYDEMLARRQAARERTDSGR
jgi:hypothetical protein